MDGPEIAAPADAANTETPHVFVSFASEDVELARRAVDSLERSGFRCWFSERDIEPAASYPASITDAVAHSGALLLILTESANTSPHVVREIELAFNARRPILPIRMSGVLPSSDLDYFLSKTQWLDAGSTLDDAELERVERRLGELLRGGTGVRRRIAGLRLLPSLAVGAALLVAAAAIVVWMTRPQQIPADTTTPGPGGTQTRATPAQDSTALSGVTVRVNPRDGQTYVWVPPGRFVMGCSTGDPDCEDDEHPAHMVDIKSGFWLARTEATSGQYDKSSDGGKSARAAANENLPKTELSWAEAKAYCLSVGGRLPSEAEWEYAARAGTTVRYYDSLPTIAWFADNADEQLHPVGTKAPNAFGLHDMLGNVSEWVRDRYYNKYDDASDATALEEPLAGNASGVARGGSWISDAQGVRASRRLEMLPDAQESHIGFRCAIDRF